jgi:protease I
MEFGLKGRHVAILAGDGIDRAQLAGLRKALGDAGAIPDVVAARSGEVRSATGEDVRVDRTFDACHAADYDALVMPGGRAGADDLRAEQRALQFVREFMAADKPVAAIAEGVRLLVAAEAVAGRSVAASPELAEEVRASGGQVVDAALHVDDKLVTSRGDADPGALDAAIVREFANRIDEARVDELSAQSFPASDPPPGPMAVGGSGASEAVHLDPRAAGKTRSAQDGGDVRP